MRQVVHEHGSHSGVSEPVTLAIHCAHCRGAVTLQFEWWGSEDPGTMASWSCPSCEEENRMSAVGRVVWVNQGHGETPANH